VSAGGDGAGAGGVAVDAGGMPTVFEARSDFEAQCVRGVLGDAGIRSVTVPTGQGIFGFPLRAGSRTVPVRVLPEDLSRARQALAEARWTGKSVDWDEVDVGEMPPEVARVVAGAAANRWVRRAALAVMWAAVGVVAVGLLASLAGCAYRLEGKVVDGYGACRVAKSGDPDESKAGIPGASVELVRDPRTMRRETCGRATTGPDGRFELEVNGFGAGWMEETWLLRVRRAGYQNVEAQLDLPVSPSGRVVIVEIQRGRSEPFREPEGAGSLMDEARRWEPGIGQSRP
jgi:hypothetical protein